MPAQEIPYKDFLASSSFVASIGIVLDLSASLSLATAITIFGVDCTTGDLKALVNKYSVILLYSAILFTLSLTTEITPQIMITSPAIAESMRHGPNFKKPVKALIGALTWSSLLLMIAALLLLGEAIKVINERAGSVLIFAIVGLAVFAFTVSPFSLAYAKELQLK